jgi:hypothetical protein
MRAKGPAIVAELGRPETPEETARRHLEATRERRSRRTVGNLIVSLMAVIAAVILIAMMAPTPRMDNAPRVNVEAAARQAAGSEPAALVVPRPGSQWRCNVARLNTGTPDGTDYWELGFVTPSNGFVSIEQGFDANPSWTAARLAHAQATGHRTIDGILWRLYDNHTATDSTVRYGLATTAGKSTFVVFGTASLPEVEHAAGSISGQITAARQGSTRE